MTEEEFTRRLEEHGLLDYKDELQVRTRSCIRLHLESKDEADLPIGTSKIGGRPDLPESIEWPYETEREANPRDRYFNQELESKPLLPLSFVAQLNLEEISRFDEENLLPRTGWLYFFYSAEQSVWGFDPRDSSGFKVLYFCGDRSDLRRIDFPPVLPDYAMFNACRITPQSEISLPAPWGESVRGLFASREAEDAYYEFQDDGLSNKIFGHADNIQGDMELECELATNGIYVGDPSGYKDPRRATLEQNTPNWRLLLQVDSNENDCGMMWGDVGRIYYWIRKDDIERQRFENAWLILQCS